MQIVTRNDNIPTCQVTGCCSTAQNTTGGENPRYRKAKWVREEYGVEEGWVCAKHHGEKIAEKRGAKSIRHVMAQNAGFGNNVTAYTNSMHPYLKYRKNYCENQDGRLGFACTYSGPTAEQLVAAGLDDTFMGWLQVDHIDGNSENNVEENLQTLCACCHTVKTAISKDYLTPGRKTIKAMKEAA
jgi:hypothetical protein